jgi:hypothetical protein
MICLQRKLKSGFLSWGVRFYCILFSITRKLLVNFMNIFASLFASLTKILMTGNTALLYNVSYYDNTMVIIEAKE